MMHIQLDEAKKHLNIDLDFKDDDNYITSLIEVAEDSVSKHLNVALSDTLIDGQLPPAIKHAILLMIGNLYANREPVTRGGVANIPFTMEYLISLYINYQKPF